MNEEKRKQKARIWFSKGLGTLFSMGLNKNDPRYREMKQRMLFDKSLFGIIITLVILIIIGGIVWEYLSALGFFIG